MNELTTPATPAILEEPVPENSVQSNDPKKGWFIAKIALLVAFLPSAYFIGYSYFKAYMSQLGFKGAAIDGSIGEVYYQTLVAFVSLLPGLNAFLDRISELWISFLEVGGMAWIIIFLTLILASRIQKVIEKVCSSSKFQEYVKKSKGQFKLAALISGVMSAAVTILPPTLLAFCSTILAACVLIFALPALLGESVAREELEKGFCQEFTWAKETRDVVVGCTTIQLKSGNQIKEAHVVYKNSKFVYVMTSQAAVSIPQSEVVQITSVLNYKPSDQSSKAISATEISQKEAIDP